MLRNMLASYLVAYISYRVVGSRPSRPLGPVQMGRWTLANQERLVYYYDAVIMCTDGERWRNGAAVIAVAKLERRAMSLADSKAAYSPMEQVEADLAAAQTTIQRLEETRRTVEEALQKTQAQLLVYAADLQQAYIQERARSAELEQAMYDLMMGMVQGVEARDPSTGAHSFRVAQYALGIATVLGWSGEQLGVLKIGAQLHDIGKIGIADQILRKPGPLTPDEYREMQTHVLIGLRILHEVRLAEPALPYVAYHHERYDGRGYPFGLAGAAIPVEGRLLAVADAFDAITSARPYRGARPMAEGLNELQTFKGTQFDPAMVDALQAAYDANLLRRGPGTRPLLGTGLGFGPGNPWVIALPGLQAAAWPLPADRP